MKKIEYAASMDAGRSMQIKEETKTKNGNEKADWVHNLVATKLMEKNQIIEDVKKENIKFLNLVEQKTSKIAELTVQIETHKKTKKLLLERVEELKTLKDSMSEELKSKNEECAEAQAQNEELSQQIKDREHDIEIFQEGTLKIIKLHNEYIEHFKSEKSSLRHMFEEIPENVTRDKTIPLTQIEQSMRDIIEMNVNYQKLEQNSEDLNVCRDGNAEIAHLKSQVKEKNDFIKSVIDEKDKIIKNRNESVEMLQQKLIICLQKNVADCVEESSKEERLAETQSSFYKMPPSENTEPEISDEMKEMKEKNAEIKRLRFHIKNLEKEKSEILTSHQFVSITRTALIAKLNERIDAGNERMMDLKELLKTFEEKMKHNKGRYEKDILALMRSKQASLDEIERLKHAIVEQECTAIDEEPDCVLFGMRLC